MCRTLVYFGFASASHNVKYELCSQQVYKIKMRLYNFMLSSISVFYCAFQFARTFQTGNCLRNSDQPRKTIQIKLNICALRFRVSLKTIKYLICSAKL